MSGLLGALAAGADSLSGSMAEVDKRNYQAQLEASRRQHQEHIMQLERTARNEDAVVALDASGMPVQRSTYDKTADKSGFMNPEAWKRADADANANVARDPGTGELLTQSEINQRAPGSFEYLAVDEKKMNDAKLAQIQAATNSSNAHAAYYKAGGGGGGKAGNPGNLAKTIEAIKAQGFPPEVEKDLIESAANKVSNFSPQKSTVKVNELDGTATVYDDGVVKTLYTQEAADRIGAAEANKQSKDKAHLYNPFTWDGEGLSAKEKEAVAKAKSDSLMGVKSSDRPGGGQAPVTPGTGLMAPTSSSKSTVVNPGLDATASPPSGPAHSSGGIMGATNPKGSVRPLTQLAPGAKREPGLYEKDGVTYQWDGIGLKRVN